MQMHHQTQTMTTNMLLKVVMLFVGANANNFQFKTTVNGKRHYISKTQDNYLPILVASMPE
jgi:hypothetical protein